MFQANRILIWTFLASLSFTTNAITDEVLVRSIALPGASLDQEITYHPSEAAYNLARDNTLKRLRVGDSSARINPSDGPWMRAETTAKIGLEFKGVGVSEGRKHLRQITAAEEALYLFEHIGK